MHDSESAQPRPPKPAPVFVRRPDDWEQMTEAEKQAWALGFAGQIKGEHPNEGMPEPTSEPSFPEPREGESDDSFRKRARGWFDDDGGAGEGEWLYLCSLWGIEPSGFEQ